MLKEIIGVSAAVLSAVGTLTLLVHITEPSVDAPIEELQIVSNTETDIIETTFTETYLMTTMLTECVTTTSETTIASINTSTETSDTTNNSNKTTKKPVKSETSTTETTTERVQNVDPEPSGKSGLTCVGTFKGTYYAGKSSPCKGGSGRTLIDCSVHGQGVKGSIAAKAIYQKYGYKKDGRTKVYIECSEMTSMSGWYYVDDCCGSSSVIDFYYYRNGNCPFRNKGVISVKVYI